MKYFGHFISNTLRDDKDILRQLYVGGNTYATPDILHVFHRSEADFA